jgi:signal transduction histidine kinase
MRLSIKTKQVAGVTVIVGLTVVLLSAWYLSQIAYIRLDESRARADLIASAVGQRLATMSINASEPLLGLADDGGLQSILQASLYSSNVTYAAITDVNRGVIAHTDASMVGRTLPAADDLNELLGQGPIAQAQAVYTAGGKTFEFSKPLVLNSTEVGRIRVGVSTLLIRTEVLKALRTPLYTTLVALIVGTLVSMLLAQIVLRPIHVIRSGLAKLGRGELDVNVDLLRDESLGDIEDSFRAVTARLAADRTELAGQRATLESVVDHLEDAVALFSPDGHVLFANPAMRAAFADGDESLTSLFPSTHPYRVAVERTLRLMEPRGPEVVQAPDGRDRLILTHLVEDADHGLMGVLLVSRNLAYLSEVENTLSYSRKLAALSRLSAGIAHEVKNPLNATMIHVELLKMKLANQPAAMEHLTVIAAQVRRLDEVVQGFLKFTRPEELKLRPVALAPLLDEALPVIRAEAEKSGVEVRVELPPDLPLVSADPGLLEQAVLNLGLNACQAMPAGGRLRIAAAAVGRQIEILFEDTGVGITPEQLARIFDLYFTTKEHGSGIGLSLVYRTIQLHDGEIEVQSTPGHGTTFRILLRQAVESYAAVSAIPAS